ncbi:MAG TPA: type IV pilin [Thermoplasmatales archaeon]|nr:type IV pilin [Thermoplasmatales archaeon]
MGEKIKRKGKRRRSSSIAASSVLETLLLLSMTVGFFTILYVSVFSFSFSQIPPAVHILGTTSEDSSIILYHRGGESISIESTIVLTIEGNRTNLVLGDYLDNTSKQDSLWSMGESLVIADMLLENQQGEILIIDGQRNMMVFHGYV